MAISKEQKANILAEYKTWLERSKAIILTEYIGLSNKDLEQFRLKVREAGGELHVVKNTLGKRAFEEAGINLPESVLEKSTAVGFAFTDAAGMAKAITEFARSSDFVKVKAGALGTRVMTPEDVKTLAELPPLPVVRAQLLGVLQAPAAKLVRTLAEPGRSVAAVIKAYADKDSAAAAQAA